jgi:putative outer membrane protein probably involved in nutrient binding
LHGISTTTDGTSITGVTEIEIWPQRTFDPVKNQVFAIPASQVRKSVSGNLKQNMGY